MYGLLWPSWPRFYLLPCKQNLQNSESFIYLILLQQEEQASIIMRKTLAIGQTPPGSAQLKLP